MKYSFITIIFVLLFTGIGCQQESPNSTYQIEALKKELDDLKNQKTQKDSALTDTDQKQLLQQNKLPQQQEKIRPISSEADSLIKIEKCKISAEIQAKESATITASALNKEGFQLCNDDVAIINKGACYTQVLNANLAQINFKKEQDYNLFYIKCLQKN